MDHTTNWVARIGILILLWLSANWASAQTLTTLLSFNGPLGQFPGSLILNGSTLYGITEGGGDYGDGNIFSIHTDGTGFQNLLSFNGTNDKSPEGGLTLSGSTLYGMTSVGGAYGYGGRFFGGFSGRSRR
jgi:hypothetical protein